MRYAQWIVFSVACYLSRIRDLFSYQGWVVGRTGKVCADHWEKGFHFFNDDLFVLSTYMLCIRRRHILCKTAHRAHKIF